MKRPFLIGKKLYLRLLDENDVSEEYLSWLNDGEVTKYLETGKFPSTLETVKKYVASFNNSTNGMNFAIIDKEAGLHIGNVTLNHINWIHRTADTGILIGNIKYHGKQYGIEAWSLLLEYAFERIGLRRITAGAIADNVVSLNLMKKLGFVEEGISRKHCFVDGEYKDAIRMGLFKEEFLNCRKCFIEGI